MADTNENNGHQFFIIDHNPETGTNVITRANKKRSDRYHEFGVCELGDVPVPALQLGASLLKLVPDGFEFNQKCTLSRKDATDAYVIVHLVPIVPPEPVGVEFLKTLESGTQWMIEPYYPGRFVKCDYGLAWVADVEGGIEAGVMWLWSGERMFPSSAKNTIKGDWREYSWVRNASKETIKPWVPDEA